MLTVDIPAEPDDRAVVLDRDTDAWQRRGGAWHRVGVVQVPLRGEMPTGLDAHVKTWPHLLVDRGPLAPMIAESAVGEDDEEPARAACATETTGPLGAAFLRHVAGGPTVVSRRAVRDEPQA